MPYSFFLIVIFLTVFQLLSKEVIARKVGLSNGLPKLERISNPNFSETYLTLKIYENTSIEKNYLILLC